VFFSLPRCSPQCGDAMAPYQQPALLAPCLTSKPVKNPKHPRPPCTLLMFPPLLSGPAAPPATPAGTRSRVCRSW
jgi:hypothetical protein